MKELFGKEIIKAVNVEEKFLAIGNHQYIITFENDYGASIVMGPYTYGGKDGLWELSVLKDGCINYDTPITDDVLGYLNEEEVLDTLKCISELNS